jgi:hypothetical protein
VRREPPNGTATVFSFDADDPSCLDIYTSSATPYEGTILFFPSAFQHQQLPGAQTPAGDGLLDVRFGSARSALDRVAYAPTRRGRAPFVPLGVNRCEMLTMAPSAAGAPQMDWCYNSPQSLDASSIDTGDKYMATGYALSADGAQVYLYSGGEPKSHGGGARPMGLIDHHSGVRRHAIRRDGFVGIEAGYGGAHLPVASWPRLRTVPLAVPSASACASGDVELRANLLSGVGGGAYFELAQAGRPLAGFTMNESLLLRGNWIDGRVGWGGDTDFGTRTLTRWSGQQVEVTVAMRDAELFSLAFGCVQRPLYTQCAKPGAPSCAAAWGTGYATIPCATDAYCRGLGTCGGHEAVCRAPQGLVAGGERVCTVFDGAEPGPVCGRF